MIKHPELLKSAVELVNEFDRIIIACHEKPDGDAAGSILGLFHSLASVKRDITCYCHNEINGNLSFLPDADVVTQALPDPLPDDTLLIVVDCNEPERLGKEGRRIVEQASAILVLDHHMGYGLCNEVNVPAKCVQYIDTDMSAAACICILLTQAMSIALTPESATCFYTAIVTDTGGFRHSNTNSVTFEFAKMLVDAGANPSEIALNLYQKKAAGSIRLLAKVLQTFTLEADGKVGVIHITPEMFHECDASESDMDDYIHYPRSVDSVKAAIFVKEIEKGHVSVSLRSKGEVNVQAIASKFGGGGHFNAAGFRTDGTAEEVRKMIVQEMVKVV
jgi:phosphoesterase RecJ-like protein